MLSPIPTDCVTACPLLHAFPWLSCFLHQGLMSVDAICTCPRMFSCHACVQTISLCLHHVLMCVDATIECPRMFIVVHKCRQTWPIPYACITSSCVWMLHVQADMAELFPHACIVSAYGMTETASSITFITLRSPPGPGTPSWVPHNVASQHRHQQLQQLTCTFGPHSSLYIGQKSRSGQQQLQQHCQQQELSAGNAVQQWHSSTTPAPFRSSSVRDLFDRAAVVGDGGGDGGGGGGGCGSTCNDSSLCTTGAVCVGWPGPGVKVKIHPFSSEGSGGVGALSIGGVGSGGGTGKGRRWGEGREEASSGGGVGGGSKRERVGPEMGEVCVQGRCVMEGYWRAPRETEEVRRLT